jgi:hypothetical protein
MRTSWHGSTIGKPTSCIAAISVVDSNRAYIDGGWFFVPRSVAGLVVAGLTIVALVGGRGPPASSLGGGLVLQTDHRDALMASRSSHVTGRRCLWRAVTSPRLRDGELHGIALASPIDGWAVGSFATGVVYPRRGLIEHWDGRRWSAVRSPVFKGGLESDNLTGVAIVSRSDVWAVGTGRTRVEHWDGKRWRIVPSPGITKTDYENDLFAVAAVSDTDVWAVGSYLYYPRPRGGVYPTHGGRPLIEHWDGRTWQFTPNAPIFGSLESIAVVSADNVWAVGSQLRIPGDGSGEYLVPLIEHWDGRSWHLVPSKPGPRDRELDGVAAVSARDVWAVGRQRRTVLTEHSARAGWHAFPWRAGQQGGRALNGVVVLTRDDIWAVGVVIPQLDSVFADTAIEEHWFGEAHSDFMIAHWNGRKWSAVPGLPKIKGERWLNAVSAVTNTDVWAVGGASTPALATGPAASWPLIEHYTCP